MDVIMLSTNLYVAYGVSLLCLGALAGLVAGRYWNRRATAPTPVPPELLLQRVQLLEQELEQTNADVRRLVDDREFMRELRPPHGRIAAA